MKKVLSIYSSARRQGNTFEMVDMFHQLLPGEVCYLDELKIAQYDNDFQNQDDDFVRVIEKMLDADVIVFASPVYWYSLTPAFRRFIDRFTDLLELPHLKVKGKQLRQKTFYLFATSVHQAPPSSFTSQVRHTLQYLGCHYAGIVHIDCKLGFNKSLAFEALQPVVSEISLGSVENRHIPQPGFAQLLCQFK